MIILLMNVESQYLEVLHLTEDEENFLLEDSDLFQEEKVARILDGRDIDHGDFNPLWMIADYDIPIFDEHNNDIPLCVLR